MNGLNFIIGVVITCLKWLALPIVVALFAQWPFREFAGGLAQQTNDFGQWLFALYVCVSVTAATRRKTHLSVDMISRRQTPGTRRVVSRVGIIFGLVPWSILILAASAKTVFDSVSVLERFPETLNPGYFLIKLALWLGALLILAQSVIDLASRKRHT